MKTTIENKKIGIIGAGNMAKALCKGLLQKRGLDPANLLASHHRPEKATRFKKDFGIETITKNTDVVAKSDIIILAVKPQILPIVLKEIASSVQEHHVVISIAAGIHLSTIHKHLMRPSSILRAMPNLPAIIGEGMTALAASENTSQEDLDLATEIFTSVGKCVVLDEDQLDAVTGLSGSGPAYTFLIIDALADAGVKVGLSRETSLLLASQTVLGSSKLLIETGEHPSKLKDQVTSPGGTAIAGIHTLEQGGIRNTLINAVEAATLRAKELGVK